MDEQGFVYGKSIAGPSAMMAAWLTSGGAVEVLAGVDAGAACSRREPLSGDDGLRAHRYTTYGDCADDGLQAGVPTGGPECPGAWIDDRL